MNGIWASLENASEAIWSSIETVWGEDTAQQGGHSQWDQVVYFINAVSCIVSSVHKQVSYYQVDWTEPWIIALMSFHLLTFFTIILSWKNFNIQAIILVFLGKLTAVSLQL